MTSKSIEEVQPLIDQITNIASESRKESNDSMQNALLKHDCYGEIAGQVKSLIVAYRKLSSSKTTEERIVLTNSLCDEIEKSMDKMIRDQRDLYFFQKGKTETAHNIEQGIKNCYSQQLGDAKKVEDLAEDQEKLQQVLETKWKPGTRPEKIAVVRRAKKSASEHVTE